MRKKWIIAITSLVVIGAIAAVLVYIFIYNKPQPDYSRTDPDFRLKASDLYHEFKSNAAVAGAKYTGKVLAVTGDLSSVENTDSLTTAVFAIEQGMFGDEGVRCAFIPEFVKEITSTANGSAVTIKGYCTGFNDTDVILEHCSLLK
ncbi:MAG: OB-fold protein [Omnitrophica WOR_2 bacterium]|jgi:hypothetical protein